MLQINDYIRFFKNQNIKIIIIIIIISPANMGKFSHGSH